MSVPRQRRRGFLQCDGRRYRMSLRGFPMDFGMPFCLTQREFPFACPALHIQPGCCFSTAREIYLPMRSFFLAASSRSRTKGVYHADKHEQYRGNANARYQRSDTYHNDDGKHRPAAGTALCAGEQRSEPHRKKPGASTAAIFSAETAVRLLSDDAPNIAEAR